MYDFAFMTIGFLAAVVVLLLIVVFIFEVAMFIDAAQNKYISSDKKILWLLGMLIIHPVVAVAYYFTDRKLSK